MKFGCLVVSGADGPERRFEIDLPSVLVGSGPGSAILLDHPSIGERHARLLVESGTLLVEDLGSESGTEIAGRRVAAHVQNRIEPGQPIRFGDLSARYIEPEPVEIEDPLRATRIGDDEPDDGSIRPLSRVILELTLTPGPVITGAVTAGTLRIANRGRVVDEIALGVSGIPPTWMQEWQPSIRLVPGGSAEIAVKLAPPAAPQARAGRHDLVVTATSGVDGRDAVEIVSFEIAPYEWLALDIDPHRATRRFDIIARNESNVPLAVNLDLVEADERMRFDLQDSRVTLLPGEERRIGLRAWLRKRPWFGRREIFVFTVGANAQGAAIDEVTCFGQLLVRPPLQPWKLPLQLLLALAVVAAVIGVFFLDWPVRADKKDFDVPAIPIINEEPEKAAGPTVARPAPTALAGAKKEDSSAALAKLEERFAGVHLCGTPKDAAKQTPVPAAPGGPLFRQADPTWANAVYAAADKPGPKSSCGKTLAQCGCEVTSMATVLALLQLVAMPDGQPLNPGTLNAWFDDDAAQDAAGWTSRGYAYGDVVWSAANALSGALAKTRPGTQKVRYLGAGSGAEDEIKTALQAKIPVVLEVPGHYIAATGLQGSTIMIADPYYPDRTTLDAYKGKMLGSVLFQPADDLSGLTVTAPAGMRIRVTDPSGKVVGTLEGATPNEAEAQAKRDAPGSSYTFKEAWRDPNCIETAPPAGAGVHQVYIAAPASGAYKVEIVNAAGGGTSAVVHVYDRDGTVRIEREEGTGNITKTIQIG